LKNTAKHDSGVARIFAQGVRSSVILSPIFRNCHTLLFPDYYTVVSRGPPAAVGVAPAVPHPHPSVHPVPPIFSKQESYIENGKMVNGSRYYRALESVNMASALSSALTIYPCHPSNADSLKFQFLTARKKKWWPATADRLPPAVTCQL